MDPTRLQGGTLVVVGLALLFISFSGRDVVLTLAAAAIITAGGIYLVPSPQDGNGWFRVWQYDFTVAVGALLAVAGLILYTRERDEE